MINLKELKSIANDACDLALLKHKNKKEDFDEAINWADLGCVQSEKYETDEAQTEYRVYIEEASPNCNKLKLFIQEYLKEKGFENIEAITEW